MVYELSVCCCSCIAVLKCIIRSFGLVMKLIAQSTSRQGGTLVLEDLLKHVAEDGLGVVWVRDVLADSQDVAALANVVLDIIVSALVRELGQANLL